VYAGVVLAALLALGLVACQARLDGLKEVRGGCCGFGYWKPNHGLSGLCRKHCVFNLYLRTPFILAVSLSS